MPGMVSNEAAGEQALEHLRLTTPPEWLAPNPELSKTARVASEFLFSCLKPYAIKCPFDRLLTDGFDAEQIWQQIDLQTQPMLSTLHREIKKFERNPKEIRKWQSIVRGEEDEKVVEEEEGEKEEKDNDSDGDYTDDLDLDDIEGFEEDDDDEEEEEEDGGRESKEGGSEEREGVVEDKFLKINELEKFLKEDEAREYGSKNNEKKHHKDEEEDDDEEEEDNYEEVNV